MVSLEEEANSLSSYINKQPSLLAVRLNGGQRMAVYAYPPADNMPRSFIPVNVVLLDETVTYCIAGEWFTTSREDVVAKLIAEFTKLRLAGRLWR